MTAQIYAEHYGRAAEEAEPWPVVPDIKSGDSLTGIIHRTASMNGITFQHVASQFHLGKIDNDVAQGAVDLRGLPAPSMRRLAARLSVPRHALDHSTVRRLFPILVRYGHDDDFRSLRLPWVYRRQTPLCVACIEEHPAHQVMWRIAIIPACTRHGLTLAGVCPRCDQRPGGLPVRGLMNVGLRQCQSCGASPEELKTAQRPLTAEEEMAVLELEVRVNATWTDADVIGLRSLGELLRALRISDPIREYLRDQFPDEVDKDRRLQASSHPSKVPVNLPDPSLLTAFIPIARAVERRRIDLLPDRLQLALRMSQLPRRISSWKLPPEQTTWLDPLLQAIGEELPRHSKAPDLAALHRLFQARNIPIAPVMALCPFTLYERLFHELLADGENYACRVGHARRSRLDSRSGRRAAMTLAWIALTGETRTAAKRSLGFGNDAGQEVLRQALWGLAQLGRTEELYEAVMEFLVWLASEESPDYRARCKAMKTDPERYQSQLTLSGVDGDQARRWLWECWVGAPQSRRGASTESGLERTVAQLPADIEHRLDELMHEAN